MIVCILIVNSGKTNKEFNLRHDWNSLLSNNDSLLFTKYSKEFFPLADTLVCFFLRYKFLRSKNYINLIQIFTFDSLEFVFFYEASFE